MIHFLLGSPGTGKTHRIHQDIQAHVTEGEHVFLIVPEQQVYSTEWHILSLLPPNEAKRVTVLSFTRLSDMLSDRYGGRAHTVLSRATRALLMWHNMRELTGLLETYGASAKADASLCTMMLHTADELACNGVLPHELEAVADKLPVDAPLRHKLRDMALVMASYDRLVCEVCGQNPADRLIRAAEQVREHGFFNGARVYLDSFNGFTAQEFALLKPLFSQADEVTVALCVDGRQGHEVHFETVYDTLRRLTKLATEVGQAYCDEVFDTVYRTHSVELSELERSLWRFDLQPEARAVIPEDERGHIDIVRAANLYDEAQAAALHILELAGSGIPYGEIAVVVRNAEAWRGVLDAALEQYHIPYFLSERTDLNTLPAARFIICALRCISRGWQTGDVIALCKTGLCGIPLRDMDYFIEYLETWRIRGRRMTEGPWSMNPDGYSLDLSDRGRIILTTANRVREAIMTPLVALEVKLNAAETVTDQCRALFEYLCDMKIKEQLSARAEEYLSLGQPREAGELVRLWSYLTEAFASVATVLPDECDKLSADELAGALSLLFAESDIGSVPARHDCVMVGTADLLRVDNIRASLLLGLNEGDFPCAVSDSGLLTEQDKTALADLGISLDSRAERRSSDELLYVWRAMTKPSDKLILSYSLTTPDGSPKSPSAAIARVRYLFDYLKVTPFDAAVTQEAAMGYQLPTADEISKPRIRAHLGKEIWQSQSRLQTYAGCPYRYFGSHILKLREQGEATFSYDTAGTFVHHVLEQYVRLAVDDHHHLRPLTDEETDALVEGIIRDYMASLCGDVSRQGRLLHRFDRLHTIARVLVQSIRAELEQSDFLPVGVEWNISAYDPDGPAPLQLPLSPTDAPNEPLPLPDTASTGGASESTSDAAHILLSGRIDRVDAYRSADGKRVYVRVVDYKNSRHDFSEGAITKDLNVQLLLYLFTLCSPANRRLFADENGLVPEEVLPAQALYISPLESSEDGSVLPYRSGIIRYDDEVLSAISRGMDATYLPQVFDKNGEATGRGVCTPEHMAELEVTLKEAITSTVAGLYDGILHRTPSTDACNYCAQRASCAIAAEKPNY